MAVKLGTMKSRAVTRETADRDPSFGRILMVRLDEGGRFLHIWQKGRRKRFTICYRDIWRLGYMAAVKASREEKQRKRRAQA